MEKVKRSQKENSDNDQERYHENEDGPQGEEDYENGQKERKQEFVLDDNDNEKTGHERKGSIPPIPLTWKEIVNKRNRYKDEISFFDFVE